MIKDIFGERIAKSLTPANVKGLEAYISQYVDSNSELLMSMDYSKRYSFADNDRDALYHAIGVTAEEAAKAVADSKAIYKSNKIQSNPFYLFSVLTARYFLMKKDIKHAELIIQYMTLNMYTSAHKGVFKYNANKQVMDYTIAHLESSFIIGQTNSIYEFLMHNTKTVVDTYQKRIINAQDSDLTYVVDATWNRLRQKLLRLGKEFYKNYESGNYLNQDTDSYGEDSFREIDNNSFLIDRLSNKVYIKLLNRQYDARLLKYAITKSDISQQRIKNMIDDIVDGDEDNTLRKVISSMIEHFLFNSGKGADYIARGDFISYMKTSYGANTSSDQLAYVKDSIDRWLTENSSKYGRTNYGRTQRQYFRKTIYMFLVFMINTEAKAS